jgi:hypothetical protein
VADHCALPFKKIGVFEFGDKVDGGIEWVKRVRVRNIGGKLNLMIVDSGFDNLLADIELVPY